MKKIKINISIVIKSRRFAAAVAVCVLCAGGAWWYSHRAFAGFVDSYQTYSAKAAVQQNAAFLPGAGDNPLRDQLNQALTGVLNQGTSPKERLALAHQGLTLVIQSNAQVDAIGEAEPDVEAAANAMESAADSPGNILQRGSMLAIVALAKQELYTIENIRGYSYRSNFDTAEVFNRIITDNGALTPAYITELNAQVPEVEDEFNLRENSYASLQRNINQIQQQFGVLTGSL